MNEHLFKLKKAGKTVGYLELRIRTPHGYPVLWFRNSVHLDEGKEWHSGNNVQADSIHPFVTKDKHGKDVFAGDCCYSGNAEGYIRWSSAELAWMFEWDDRCGDTRSEPVSRVSAIELIEDKDNE